MKNIMFTVLFSCSSMLLFAQNKNIRILPQTHQYNVLLDEPGNPLPGNPALILNFFAENEGSYLFFLNEAKTKGISYLSDKARDLYAGLYLEDHGGALEQITFKDFAGPLSQPVYLLDYCMAADVDQNNSPEFYLTYFEESDGLDAKPLKVIVYNKKDKRFVKAKITAWIPFQPEDQLKADKDLNFENLPLKVQKKAEELLNKAKANF